MPGIPRPARGCSPRSSRPPRPTRSTRPREGYPDLIALPDEPYWVRTKLTSGSAWVEPDANLPGTHRPEGIVAFAGADLPAGPQPQGRPERRHPDDPRAPRPADPGPHRGHADRRVNAAVPVPDIRIDSARHDRPAELPHGPHARPFEYTSKNKRHRAAPGRARLPGMIAERRHALLPPPAGEPRVPIDWPASSDPRRSRA